MLEAKIDPLLYKHGGEMMDIEKRSLRLLNNLRQLNIFFGLENYTQSQVILFIAVHFTFVLSGVLLAYMDSLTAKGKK